MNIAFTQSTPARRPVLPSMLLAAALIAAGCGKSDDDLSVATTPKEAASQLESAFANAPEAFRGAADTAADALRKGQYVEAVESLQAIKASQDVSVQQGVAVHSSMVQLENQLLQAIDAGDERAKAAYARLKAMKAK